MMWSRISNQQYQIPFLLFCNSAPVVKSVRKAGRCAHAFSQLLRARARARGSALCSSNQEPAYILRTTRRGGSTRGGRRSAWATSSGSSSSQFSQSTVDQCCCHYWEPTSLLCCYICYNKFVKKFVKRLQSEPVIKNLGENRFRVINGSTN